MSSPAPRSRYRRRRPPPNPEVQFALLRPTETPLFLPRRTTRCSFSGSPQRGPADLELAHVGALRLERCPQHRGPAPGLAAEPLDQRAGLLVTTPEQHARAGPRDGRPERAE